MSLPWYPAPVSDRTNARLDLLTDAQYRVWHRLRIYSAEQEERFTIEYDSLEVLAAEVARGDIDLLNETLERLGRLHLCAVSEGRIAFPEMEQPRRPGNARKPSDDPAAAAERKRRQRVREREGFLPLDDADAPEEADAPPDVTRCHALSRPCHAPVTPPTVETVEGEVDREGNGSTPPVLRHSSAASVQQGGAGGESPPDAVPDADADAAGLVERLQEIGVNRSDAVRLADTQPAECRRQLAMWPFRPQAEPEYWATHHGSPGGALRAAIEAGWGPPQRWFKAERAKETAARRSERERAAALEQQERDAARRALDAAVEAARRDPDRAAAIEQEAQERLRAKNPLLWQRLRDGKTGPAVEAALLAEVRAIVAEQQAAAVGVAA